MNDDYLWDKSGEPDPDVERLESLLGRFRFDAEAAPRAPAVVRVAPRRPRLAWVSAMAASLAIAILAARAPMATPSIAMVAHGPVLVGQDSVEGKALLPAGAWLETSDARARLTLAADIGTVDVNPRSRIKLVEATDRRQRLELARGSIRASVDAPPRLFIVDTPSARAVDLGCAYTLHVEPDGSGSLSVDTGWVALETGGRDAYVPAGAVCEMRPGVGPGTPRFRDAPAELHEALDRLDFGGAAEGDLAIVLATARERDTLTLWHLLARVPESDRTRVFERLASLAPPPATLERANLLALDEPSLVRWRDSLEDTWAGSRKNATKKAPSIHAVDRAVK